MKLPEPLIVCIVSVVGILSWAIFSFSNYEATSESEPSSVVDFSDKGTIGYVIVEDPSIYFIFENYLMSMEKVYKYKME
jgi:hypothetical protein